MTADDPPLRLRRAIPDPDGSPEPEPMEIHVGPEASVTVPWEQVRPPADRGRPGPDADRVRALAAEIGQPGVPVSLRAPDDRPGPGAGTGHWHRHATRLAGAVERCRRAVAAVPPGAVHDELGRLLHIVDLRAARYLRIVEVGQAVAPDDDTTLADGTPPGVRPGLDGAAAEIDERLVAAADHLAGVARAVEEIASAARGSGGVDGLAERLAAVFATMPDA